MVVLVVLESVIVWGAAVIGTGATAVRATAAAVTTAVTAAATAAAVVVVVVVVVVTATGALSQHAATSRRWLRGKAPVTVAAEWRFLEATHATTTTTTAAATSTTTTGVTDILLEVRFQR